MTNQSISAIATQGMEFERNRLEIASLRISLANSTFSTILEAEAFASSVRSSQSELINHDQDLLQIKSILDKQNPQANEAGYVYKFDIDPTHEMATLVSATRAYEANVRAYNTNSQMNKAALDIGGK